MKSRKHGSSESRNGEIGLLLEGLTRRIIGAAITVHKTLGPGFVESIYENALCLELSRQGIPFARQMEVPVSYLGEVVGTHRLDLVIEEQVVVELKAVGELVDAHFAQLRSYLKASGLKVGLLLNFGTPLLQAKRVVN